MRTFNYSKISENKWDSELLGLIAAIYKEAGKQELYLKQRPQELEKLVATVMSREDLKYCPHGRPICITLSKKQLEKQFKR